MAHEAAQLMQQVIRHCEALLELARRGDRLPVDGPVRIALGRIRDAAYQARRVALELSSAAARVPDQAGHEAGGPRDGTARKPVCPAPSAPSGRKVLVVDDDGDVATSLRRWFEDRGFLARCAADGAEALERIEADRPDLVTLDVRMPGTAGESVFRRLRGCPQWRHIPVIVITAAGESPRILAEQGRPPLSPDGFLAKPIDLRDLAVMVKRLMA
jgi:CheY-like chemotaxis protein